MAIVLHCAYHCCFTFLNIFLQSKHLYMNSSQLLYKISNLQHSVRMKKTEYARALNSGDQINIDLSNASLMLLKEDLAVTVKAFNSIPAPNSNNKPENSKKNRWWQNIFNLKAVFNRK